MNFRFYALLGRLRASYWFVPALMAVGAVVLSVVCVHIDDYRLYKGLQQSGWIFGGGAEGARAVLSTIAGSIITVAGTTFSITVAALSLTAAQFGPRLLRNFMRDTGNQVVLGTFTSTFLYCLLILRTVRGTDNDTYVPHVSVTTGVFMAVCSLGVLIYFIHHVAESIQVSHLIEAAGKELDSAVSRLFPERIGHAASETDIGQPQGVPVHADRIGYVQALDSDQLMKIAVKYNACLFLVSRPGDYVFPGSILARATAAFDENRSREVRDAVSVGRARTPDQDPVFAFLQVADIGIRALSPGVNDPLTAMMCIDRITAAMCCLADRALPEAARKDANGKLRVIAHPYDYQDLVKAAYLYILEAARNQPEVKRHLRKRIELVARRTEEQSLRGILDTVLARVPLESA